MTIELTDPACDKICCNDGLPPQDAGDDGGKEDGEDDEEDAVVAVLEHDERLGLQVGHVDGLPARDDTGMFPHTEPTNVGEQETSPGIVRIRRGL